MAVSDAFLTTCRTAISRSLAWTAFQTANTLSADTRAGRAAMYAAMFVADSTGSSAASRLAGEIRNIVTAQCDINATAGSGVIGGADRELAVQTLTAEYIPVVDQPLSDAVESAALNAAIIQDYTS